MHGSFNLENEWKPPNRWIGLLFLILPSPHNRVIYPCPLPRDCNSLCNVNTVYFPIPRDLHLSMESWLTWHEKTSTVLRWLESPSLVSWLLSWGMHAQKYILCTGGYRFQSETCGAELVCSLEPTPAELVDAQQKSTKISQTSADLPVS